MVMRIMDTVIPAVLYVNAAPAGQGLPKGDQTQ